jgi:GLPGLI family protein
MKTFFLFLAIPFFAICQINNGPSILVTYEYSNAFITNQEYLLANNKEAVYLRPSINKKIDAKIIDKGDGNYEIPLSEIKTSSVSIYMNSVSNEITSYTVADNYERYIVKDSTFLIEWNVEKKIVKVINGFNCFKATTKFRGRDYIAYFTDEISVKFGPFKFKGLPGLILELYNTESDITHKWIVSTIKSSSKSSLKFPLLSELSAPSINLFQFTEINRKLSQERLRQSNSRTPKGVSFVSSKITNLGIEKIYEWETEDEEKK